MNWKKRLLKHGVAAVLILIVTIAAEMLIFNGNSQKNSYNVTYKEKNKVSDGFAVRKYGDEKAAVLVIDECYVNKLNIAFDSDREFNYKIVINTLNKFDYEEEKEITDRYYPELGETFVNVGNRSTKIKIIYPGDVVVESINISNEIKWNIIRMLFVAFTLGLLYSFFTCKRLVGEHIEYAFLMGSVLLGSIMVLALPEDFRSWDEQIHFNRAYMYSFGENVEYTEAAWRLKTLDIPHTDSAEDRLALQKLLNDEDEIIKEVEKDGTFITYGGRAYMGQAFGMWLARTCGWKFTTGMILARYLNLAVYILLMFLAIKYAKHGKRILTLIGLLPTSLFLAASFSYDAHVTAFVTFGFVMIVNEFADLTEKINYKRIIAGVVTIVVGCFAKAVYIPLILLLCFIPKEKFYTKMQKWMFRLSIVIVFLVMMSTFVLPIITNASSGIETDGDQRGGDTSVSRQLELVVSHPVEYTELFVSTVVKTAPDYFLGYQSRTFFAYLGGNKGILFYLSLIVTVFVAFTEGTMEQHLPLARKTKLALSGIILCVIGLVWTALYLSFTPVGLNAINGVQPRYYIPLMFPVILLIENGRVRCHRVSEFRYNQIVLYSGVIVLAGMIYEFILMPCAF